jgi:hypothetical protein
MPGMETAGSESAGGSEGGESADGAGEEVMAGGEDGWGEEAGGSDGIGGNPGESDAFPDMSDEELEASLEDFDESMEDAQGQSGAAGGFPSAGDAGSAGEQAASGQGGGNPAGGGYPAGSGQPGGQGGGVPGAMEGSGFPGGTPGGGFPGSTQPAGAAAVLTGAEQVAILEAQLEQGTGDFDDLILEERERIRQTAKSAPAGSAPEEEPAGYGGASGGVPEYGAGSGRGRGGEQGPVPRDKYEGDFPQQAAVYPPPGDIPSGDDDDVVARQLREAAMREPDPQLREKLWDEYRKYKGIKK